MEKVGRGGLLVGCWVIYGRSAIEMLDCEICSMCAWRRFIVLPGEWVVVCGGVFV